MVKNNTLVAVLLSTYNGAQYLEELLDSLMKQTFNNYKVFIRDDGSKDSTKCILSKYKKKYPLKICIIEDCSNKGATQSFLYLLSQVVSDYYMFCDQDDVWKDDKVERSYNYMLKIEKQNINKPIIVHTDVTLTDEHLSILSLSYWDYMHINYDISHEFSNLCHFNDVIGCTMIINKHLKDLFEKYSKINIPKFVYHDYLLAMITSAEGGLIVPFKVQTLLYRRHSNNATTPTKNSKSIVYHLKDITSFIQYQKERYLFANSIKSISIYKFALGKIRVKLSCILKCRTF